MSVTERFSRRDERKEVFRSLTLRESSNALGGAVWCLLVREGSLALACCPANGRVTWPWLGVVIGQNRKSVFTGSVSTAHVNLPRTCPAPIYKAPLLPILSNERVTLENLLIGCI